MTKNLNESRRELHEHLGAMNYHLEVFGDELAKRRRYKTHSGMDAIWFYLIEKYHWTPGLVRSMNHDDLRFLMQEEMHGWKLPKMAR